MRKLLCISLNVTTMCSIVFVLRNHHQSV